MSETRAGPAANTAASTAPSTAPNPVGDLLELVIGGMTCSSCAARIERRLNRLDGVTATVNYATERAYVTATGGRDAAELIGVIEATGYAAARPAPAGSDGDEPPGPSSARRLAVCLPLAAVVVVLSMVPAAQFAGWQWLSLLLAGPVAVWGAWPFHRAAWLGLGHGTATMDTLVSLGVTASLGWSLFALLFGSAGTLGMRMPFTLTFGAAGSGTIYLDVAAGVTAAVLTGRYLESRAKSRSGAALTALAELGARTVLVLRDGGELRVPIGQLACGEQFVVRPGERVATDGVVVDGRSAVNAALLTGESAPAEVGPGDEVTGSCVNMSGRLVVRATRVGADTVLARITRVVSQALATKAAAQRLADRVAAVFVPCVLAVAVATLGFWLGSGLPAAAAWSAAVAVLVVACPCALGLATPTALLAAIGRGAELGILVTSAQALESAGRIRAVILDKTGTLTTGRMTLHEITTVPGTDEEEVLRLAGAVEDASEHPAGQAIASSATARLGGLPPVTGFASVPGAGVRGTAAGHAVIVGNGGFFAELGVPVPGDLLRSAEAAQAAGRTAVLAGWDGQARAVLAVGDTIRPGSAEAVARLRRLGVSPVLLTGDSQGAAQALSARLGIAPDRVFGGVGPEGKARVIQELQAGGIPVAMVGDGVNDAAALAQADLGMAIGTGTDAAIGAADLNLVSGDPRAIADALQLARATMGVSRANLKWAFSYNVIAIPLAALGYLNPLFAGIAMAASSLLVVTSSLRLRRFQPSRSRPPRPSQPPPSQSPLPTQPPLPSGVVGPLLSPQRQLRPGHVARPRPGGRQPRDLVLAAAPVTCAVVLVGLLSAWVGIGGGGTLSRVRIRVGLAAIPMSSFTASSRAPRPPVGAYLTIRNVSGRADELTGASSPAARRVLLTRPAGVGAGAGSVTPGLVIPAHGIVTLTPFGNDLEFLGTGRLRAGQQVPLTLVFRNAGRVTVEATVTAPGAP
jgi:P-type Cu+ transporter